MIEIKGVSISKHVEHTMNWVTGINPTVDVGKVGREISASVQSHLDQIKKVDAEFSPEDQEQLNELIKKAERKKASH